MPATARKSLCAIACCWLFSAGSIGLRAEETVVQTELLVVGGGESACAAAVQAARLGVARIMLVNDMDWLGGQFSSEGVGCLDEWTSVAGKRVNFPRSGMFLEMVRLIRAENSRLYGFPSPGNAYCGTETVEPAVAARLFEQWVGPYLAERGGPLRIERQWQPLSTSVNSGRLSEVLFEGTNDASRRLRVRAALVIDASDWGDVIRLSGARYSAGPDLRSRFGEPSAPERLDEIPHGHQEMNPISWCVVLRERTSRLAAPGPETPVAPPGYDARSFTALDTIPPWVDSDMSAGIYSQTGWSIYTHRRLVDRRHNGLAEGTEATFLNWPTQDYPLCQLPKHVIEELERAEPGASTRNIVDLSPRLRGIVFQDAKRHALGFLHHLQTKVHDRVGDFPESFRHLRLTTEFGTPDNLPPKPYVREGLRLEALYMLREQDIRAETREPRWAKSLPEDSVLGFQFNIDFHPTRRKYEGDDPAGPWRFVHTPNRNWHTDTDRAGFPLRGLVPVERDGLIGAGKNIGVTSVVQSALRLHGQMMLVGQAAGTLAAECLREAIRPRDVAADPARVRQLQQRLAQGAGGPGVLLFPWQDVDPDHPAFAAVNLLSVRGIVRPPADSVLFRPEGTITRAELAGLLVRLLRCSRQSRDWPAPEASPAFVDVAHDHPERRCIETMIQWGHFGPQSNTFSPEAPVNRGTLHRWLTALDLPVDREYSRTAELPVSRAEAAHWTWNLLRRIGEQVDTVPEGYLSTATDSDGDGRVDRDDPLPLDRDNDNRPDRVDED